MIANQRYSFTGSSNYDFNYIDIPKDGIALFDTNTGVGGVDYMPADGDTVTVVLGYSAIGSNDELKKFTPLFNNAVYYLVSDTVYGPNDNDTMISLATSIPVVLGGGGEYTGTFIFSNPNDFKYLYLIFDYTDNFDTKVISYTGSFNERIIDVDYGSDRGTAGVSYVTPNKPVRYRLYWNNYLIEDTGYIGLNSISNYNGLLAAGVDPSDIKLVSPLDGLVNNGTGSIEFNKFLTLADGKFIINAPLSSTSFTITREDPSLTDFYIDTADGDSTTVCAQVPFVVYRHDGSGTLPVVGDKIYIDSAGSNIYDGNNAYHQYNTTATASGDYIVVDNNGVVVSTGTCNCSEVAIPVVTPSAFVFTVGQNVNVQLEATNNPTSWDVVATCDEYTLNGGTTGTVFNITDCTYGSTDVTVSIDETKIVCSSSVPTIVGGTGTQTLNGVCLSSVLPKGLSFDLSTGIISGSLSDECDFTFDVTATNCFGTSLTETISISIIPSNKFKPFLIDVENFGTDGPTACAVTSPLYSVLYHNGAGDVPVVGDYVIRTYTNSASAEPFFGGCMYYVVYGSADVLKICQTGKVCDAYTCP